MSTYLGRQYRAQELCESRGGLPGLSVPNKPDGLCGRKAPCLLTYGDNTERRSCLKVELAVPGSSSLISLMVSVDVKYHVYLLRETIQSAGAV